MISSGANNKIPESANTMSTTLFGVIPTGAGVSEVAKRKTLRVSARLFIAVLQKKLQPSPQFHCSIILFFTLFLPT
jgi:hypothetical protein